MPYASVNGLEMYYEIHGAGHPLLLIHGAFSGIGTSFGKILPELARNHQVVALELQGHARTADIDRPMSIDQHAEDVVALIRQLGLGRVDLFGYSMGAGVALQVAIAHPELVRKLVLASFTINEEGIHPGLMENIGAMAGADGGDAVARRIHAAGAEPRRLRQARGQEPADGHGVLGLVGRGGQGRPGADDAHLRRLRHRPPRARGRDVPAVRGRRDGRPGRYAALTARDCARHHALHGARPRRLAGPDG